jgi:hypothetical protein
VFVSAEALVDVSFPAALARLADLARGGLLTSVSHGAYGDGLTGLARGGPLAEVPGMSKLVEVQVLNVVTRGDAAVLALRWQATGPGGRLRPALDADIWLTPAGEHSARLSLAGVYRPPLGALGAGLDRAVLHQVANATVRSLLARVADVLTLPQDPAETVQGTGTGGGAARRTGTRNALARRPARGRIRLMVIEHDVPDVPDRQVQLAEGVPDFAYGPAVAVEQPERCFQGQSRREDPVDHDIVQGARDAVPIPHQDQGHLPRIACPPGPGVVHQ